MTFADFIAKTGAQTISGRLGLPAAQIYVWKNRNHIPRERWPELLVAFPEMKVDDLFAMDHARRQSAG